MATLKAGLAALWMILLVDAIPGIGLLGRDNQARWFLLSVVVTGSMAVCHRHTQRPADEIFAAGREYERRVMLREMNECRVLPFDRSGS
ncbi:MAG: hypothetical protein ACXVXP_08405 [Mycobacteriaceae bacterium]